MSQFSEHDYSTLECLLNNSWANKRWDEQLPRKIPIDTLFGSMVEASNCASAAIAAIASHPRKPLRSYAHPPGLWYPHSTHSTFPIPIFALLTFSDFSRSLFYSTSLTNINIHKLAVVVTPMRVACNARAVHKPQPYCDLRAKGVA